MSVETTVAPAPAQAPARMTRGLLEAQTTDDGRDSGYATYSPSPDGKSVESTWTSSLDANASVDGKARPAPPALWPLADFAEFEKTVDDATLSRFTHVHSQLEKPLLAYIRSKIPGKKYRPIALRLMVLGRSEDDAKPCIVVLCPEQQSKRVRKFFDKGSVRTLCRPEDGTLPSFEVFVFGRPPETTQADQDIDVLIPIMGESEGYTTETYCGAPIVIRQPSGVEKGCTFGGVIKTAWSNGDVKLYGLTVGHLLLGDLEDGITLGTESDGTERSDDWGFELSDSESEAESDDSAEEEQDDETQLSRMMDEFGLASAWKALKLSKIGSISKDSPQYQLATTAAKYGEPKAYYDWALIDMVSYKPNRIQPRKLTHDEVHEDGAFKFGDLMIPASPSSGKKQPVVLVSGSEGLKRGSLSPLPSRLLLAPGKEFVNALVLKLDSNKQILDGDSGSWVVNEKTLEVYGYVVAADAFGGGYILPLIEAFQNIKETLGCQSVTLATTIDMASAELERVRDMNGEPAAAMDPILAEHSVLSSSPIMPCVSTPATHLSMPSNYNDPLGLVNSHEEHFMFPTFAQEKLLVQPEVRLDDNLEPPPIPKTGDSYTVSLSSDDDSNNTSRPGTSEVTEHAEDDTAVSSRPLRQVDFLSHDWKEEDIWSSWKYVVTRRNEFHNGSRLENASWRVWMKVKNQLKTISPETINWLKDCDVTWLYGPLQSGAKPIHDIHMKPSSILLSETDSMANKMNTSEVILQRVVSTGSLLSQAVAAVQAQETRGILRPNRHEIVDYFAYPLASRRMSGASSSLAPSTELSGITSPNTERKHIHFNEKVAQFIAIDVKGSDDEDNVVVELDPYGDSSGLDDGTMMRSVRTKKQSIFRRRTLKSKSTEGKTIAILPSTTVKHRVDAPLLRSPPIFSSSSQETLRPAKPSGEFFFGKEDDDS